MNRIPVTRQQRANAREALDVMWPSIPAANVDLSSWLKGGVLDDPSCETIACFGGWCAVWPSFVAQGVCRGRNGKPVMMNDGCALWSSYDVALQLFGARWLFALRGDLAMTTIDPPLVSGHAVVTARLRWLIAHSTVVDSGVTP